MLHTILNVAFVLIAIAIVALILLQRGAGAQAGSGFGAGASATVFGARGSANFLSSATKWLSVLFFSLTLFMAWQAARDSRAAPATQDLGVMGSAPAAPGPAPAAPTALPGPAATPAVPAAVPSEPVIAPAVPAPTGAMPEVETPATTPQPESEPPAAGGEGR